MKYYDPINKQLIYIGKKATSSFWDAHWNADNKIRSEIMRCKDSFVSKITKKYLKPGEGTILEGGCGQGHNVASLLNNDYTCIGIDYAEKTVKTLNQYVPELDIRIGDVRQLPFDNNYFRGYWSLGVIEHFWEGYEQIAREMFRVIKDDGYLFLTFPYMSPLRNLKTRFGLYEIWPQQALDDFYQFALNKDLVVRDFQKTGFKLVDTVPYGGLKGTKDEISFLKPSLQKLYDFKGKNKLVKGAVHLIRNMISMITKHMAAHCILLILKK